MTTVTELGATCMIQVSCVRLKRACKHIYTHTYTHTYTHIYTLDFPLGVLGAHVLSAQHSLASRTSSQHCQFLQQRNDLEAKRSLVIRRPWNVGALYKSSSEPRLPREWGRRCIPPTLHVNETPPSACTESIYLLLNMSCSVQRLYFFRPSSPCPD